MTRFRPCIDLHTGQVKQIIGGTLSDNSSDLKTNHVSTLPAKHFAILYKDRNLTGAHLIMLGPGNEKAAEEALKEWPQFLQVGGGINEANAKKWISKGAKKVRAFLDSYIVLIYFFVGHYHLIPFPGGEVFSRPPQSSSASAGRG